MTIVDFYAAAVGVMGGIIVGLLSVFLPTLLHDIRTGRLTRKGKRRAMVRREKAEGH